MGVIGLGLDVFTSDEGGEVLRIGEEAAEHMAEEGIVIGAEDEVKGEAENEIEEILISEENKIPSDELNHPTESENAPTYKKRWEKSRNTSLKSKSKWLI